MSAYRMTAPGHPVRTLLIAAVTLAVLLVLGLIFPGHWLRDTMTSLFASGLLAMSLHLLIGYSGLVSFGHAAYFALGGYVFGMTLQAPGYVEMFGGWSLPVAVVLAMLGTGAAAFLVGLLCARLSEIYFAFLTLAFQMLFLSLIQGFVRYTGGDQGLTGGIPRPPFLGIDVTQSWDRYAFCATVFVLGILVIRLITESSFGFTLRMLRDNEARARFLGINTYRTKVTCFAMAGALASLGGVILAIFTSAAYPEWASWTKSGEAIFMIMLGGVSNFLGPLVGALAMRVIDDVTLVYTTHTELAKGLVILFVVLVLKRGILDFALDRHRSRAERRTNRARTAAHEKEQADAAS